MTITNAHAMTIMKVTTNQQSVRNAKQSPFTPVHQENSTDSKPYSARKGDDDKRLKKRILKDASINAMIMTT